MKSHVLVTCLLALTTLVPAQDSFTAEHLARARALHERVLVLDTHSDTTPSFEDAEWDFTKRHDTGHMDLPRLREGGFNAQFWSIWMGKMEGEGRAIRTAIERIDSVHELIRKHPGDLVLATTADEVRRAQREGRIACLMGVEGGHIIEDSLRALRTYHRLGCRYMTLTHSFNTSWADSAGYSEDPPEEHGGLTSFGQEIVLEMNRLGMMVDISHVSVGTFHDALATTKAPVIASHSSARAISDHRRNLSDDQLRAVRDNGGVVMINFFSGFIDPDWETHRKDWEATHDEALKAMAARFKANRRAFWEARRAYEREHPMPRTPLVVLAKHVEHAAKVMGWDHVGIGADWDGVSALPEDMQHCGELPKLTALLLARGAREEDLEKFLGKNLLRVMEDCERVASRLR